jgi:hypothetical protein
MSALNKEDVARLHTYLVVPIAVGDALVSGTPLEGETQYALHVALSEIDPDSALLAIALSAHRIAQEFSGIIPLAGALKMESNKIIEDYAPDWLAHYHDHPVTGDDLYDLLSHVPEDLESLADLLEAVQACIRDSQEPAHALCGVLAVQARAHMEIADYVLSELENEQVQETAFFDGVEKFETPTLYADIVPGSNIILFPAHRRR